ncbi:MAG: 5'-nucleotidase C-terminal domain-containing protein [Tannerellaceae bacterium]|nr:5'-nucleotidase C-terminal domain-containing protein [Tannerellaceae bacterium]
MLKICCYLTGLILLVCSCHRGYHVVSLEGKYLPVTTTSHPDREAIELINRYQSRLYEATEEVIGYAVSDLTIGKPESPLTNFTSDVLLTLDEKYTKGSPVDFSLMNVNGHRAPIRKGNITTGDMYNTYSFENELIVLWLTGKEVLQVFDAYARLGGAGISGNVRLRVKDKMIKEASINNLPVEEERIYTVVTLDYLAEGNDGMQALTKALSTEPTGITLREYVTAYIRRQTAGGKQIEATTDQRILIE